ncbi:MAG: SDR family oxidoreductase [Myxococcaceae bacterium]|nr:SDR family oxidoreductase [Myxococcaceae bacterium]
MIVAVTGSRRGLGRSLAEHFLAAGAWVYGCSREPSDLTHARYVHTDMDVTDERAVKEFFRAIRKDHDRLDVLVNNAGTAVMNHVLLTPRETLSRLVEVNLVGTFLCSREAVKLLKKSDHGRIVTLSSIVVPLRLPGAAAYAASKSAVESLMQTMSKELAPLGITVNTVGPTPVPTALARTVPKEALDQVVAQQAIKRLGTAEDVINVVDFFVRPESDFVTGQTIYLGGVCA